MRFSKVYFMNCLQAVLAINPLAIAIQLLVTIPAVGAIVIAAIISFIAPPASGFNTIPRMAAEFVYEKTQIPASKKNHIVFFRCNDPAPQDMEPKPVECKNLIREEMPIDQVTTLFGNIAMFGYAISWGIGFFLFGIYRVFLSGLLKIIVPHGILAAKLIKGPN